MSIAPELLRKITEAALMAAGKPLSIVQLQLLFDEEEKPSKEEFQAAFEDIQNECHARGFELIEVANGWRFQVRQELALWIGRLWEEKPQKYSRAILETLALIAYRQPITRGDIEQIRGVAVSSHIIKSLLEREWVKVVGHRDVPGRPAMYATTRDFLDYFNLKSLEELPTLAEIKDLDSLNQEFNLEQEAPPTSLEFREEDYDESNGIDDDLQVMDNQAIDNQAIDNNENELVDDPDESKDVDAESMLNDDVLVTEKQIDTDSEDETSFDNIVEPVDTEKESSDIE